MLPAGLYTPLYYHSMLLVVSGCALLYWTGRDKAKNLALGNQVAMVVIGVGVLLFIGFRPVSGVFIDMPNYAWSYERVQKGVDASFGDGLFNGLMRMCAPVLPTAGFFLVCALIYIAPIAIASWRVHGAWAFPVFLACLTALSFWGYGVNGIRNGMATSVLILAFAFHDKPILMVPLMAAAIGFHGSVLLPAGAFLIVRYVKRTEIWLAFWALCVPVGFFAGNVGGMLLALFNPLTSDDRIERYMVNAGDAGGFRADFLAYSIVPVLVTLLLAAPNRARLRRFVARVRSRSPFNWTWSRNAMSVKRMEMGRLAGLHGPSPVRRFALAGFGAIRHDPRSGLRTTLSTINPSSRRIQMQADLSRRSHTKADQPATCERSSALGGQPVSGRHDQTKSAWGQLPWVQFLRTDPFYARLVNTYLLSNAMWVLVIHAEFSNRFAYLSWFMMPWVLLYPFVPGKINHRPRAELIAAILFAHFLFTFVMVMVVVPLRGRGIL